MKKILLVIIFVYIVKLCYSQTDFRKGFIVKHDSDTTYGLINIREGENSYSNCQFKESENTNSINYSPEDILGYGFSDYKYYKSMNIEMVDSSFKKVFIEMLVKGRVSLYKYRDTFYVQKMDSSLFKLTNEEKIKEINGRAYTYYDKMYIKILTILLFDCEELRSRIDGTKLYEKSITNLIVKYNELMNSAVTDYKAKIPWIKISPGISGGMVISQLKFNVKDAYLTPANAKIYRDYSHLKGSFTNKVSPIAGFSLDISSPRINEQFSLQTDITYFKSKFSSFRLSEKPPYIIRDYVTIEINQIHVPVGIKYCFRERKYTPFLNLGVLCNFHTSTSSEWIQDKEVYNEVTTTNNNALKMTKYQLGALIGAGVQKSISNHAKAYMEVKIERTTGIYGIPFWEDPLLSSGIYNLIANIGIRFK